MELHHLRCLVAIADHGSFTDAALSLGLTQPALSYAIGRFEKELGTRVFDRTTSGSRLTAVGEAILGPARRALGEADNVRATVDDLTGVVTGSLRIASIRTAGVETAELAGRFSRSHRGVRLVLSEPTGDREVIDAIRGGQADVGVMRAHEVPGDLGTVPLGDQQVMIVYREGTAPPAEEVSRRDLRGLRLVVPLAGSRIRSLHDQLLEGGDDAPVIAAECSSSDSRLELVREGVGACISSSQVGSARYGHGLEVRPLKGVRIPLSLVTSRWPSPAALALRDLVEADGDEARPH